MKIVMNWRSELSAFLYLVLMDRIIGSLGCKAQHRLVTNNPMDVSARIGHGSILNDLAC
jgi:hypothetical protein